MSLLLNKNGEIVTQENRAETAAVYLKEQQWGKEGEEWYETEMREKLKVSRGSVARKSQPNPGEASATRSEESPRDLVARKGHN